MIPPAWFVTGQSKGAAAVLSFSPDLDRWKKAARAGGQHTLASVKTASVPKTLLE
jgi:hypothetical protein